jgi:hypothetical protein
LRQGEKGMGFAAYRRGLKTRFSPSLSSVLLVSLCREGMVRCGARVGTWGVVMVHGLCPFLFLVCLDLLFGKYIVSENNCGKKNCSHRLLTSNQDLLVSVLFFKDYY